jgi:hypothetical protein
LGSHNWQSIRLYCLGWHERQDEIPRANTASNQWHPNHRNPIRNFIIHGNYCGYGKPLFGRIQLHSLALSNW